MNFRISLMLLFVLAICGCKEVAKEKVAGEKSTGEGTITSTGYWIPEHVEEIKDMKGWGPYVRLEDGNLLTVNANKSMISKDEGKTWTEEHAIFTDSTKYSIGSPVMIRTTKNIIILAFSNGAEMANWNWNNTTHDSPGATLPTYVVRSLDGGKTWQDLQKLHSEWTGMIRDIIETKDGSVVFTSMKMLHNPGRHTVMTYTSSNGGVKWVPSNIIDLGGIGNHSGVMESTLVQLKDGTLWMILRTNWGNFWQAFSNDEGWTWKEFAPTNIDASSSPGIIHRLNSGRLVFIWNRLYPEGKKEYTMRPGDNNLAEVPASWQREEVSMMLSDDDGNTWTKPVVIAKAHADKKKWMSYPYIFEVKPGELWITMLQCDLRIKLNEKDFVTAQTGTK
ncbi:sialidase family protein [Chitinophaga sp. MM2321]|uniref:sialidase family protein n=1 Tax=Chitinophaga sp. MM2321 TaxID=3137178 RepID=UPI0032D56F96